ncbi:MAG: hypothetical protein GY906_22450 [bacterium]|nr:hypothetical protein [bacterium]
MPAFGLSTAGKEAKGFPREMGAWTFKQFKNWLDKSEKFGQSGQAMRDLALQYWKQQAAAGAPDVGDVRGTGEQIMPFKDVLAKGGGRLEDILSAYQQGVTPANMTADQISRFMDEQAGNIGRTSDQVRDEITESALREAGISSRKTNELVEGATDDYGNLIDIAGQGFGELRGRNRAAFDDVRDLLGEGFTTAYDELEQTRPTGEFRAGTVARSFAPEVARTMRSLKKFGIDPNSPEGQAAMSRVGGQRARAIDDVIGRESGAFADRAMRLALTKGGALSDAARQELAGELGLGQAQMGTDIGLRQALSGNVQGLKETDLARQLGIEGIRSGRAEGNVERTADRSNQLLQQRALNAQLQRAMQQQDWEAVSNIKQQMNQMDLLGVQLGKEQFGQGQQFEQWMRDIQNQPFQEIAGMGQQDIINMLNSANAARGFGNDASRNYAQTYANELPSSAWLTKALGGVGMGALNMFTGGGAGALAGLLKPGGGGGGGALPTRPSPGANPGLWPTIPAYF